VHPDRPRDPAGVALEPTAGAIVQELFRRYAQDHETLVGLSKYLLQLGIKSPHGKRCWSSATLRGGIVNLMKKSLIDPFLVRKADGLQVVKIKGCVKEENYG